MGVIKCGEQYLHVEQQLTERKYNRFSTLGTLVLQWTAGISLYVCLRK